MGSAASAGSGKASDPAPADASASELQRAIYGSGGAAAAGLDSAVAGEGDGGGGDQPGAAATATSDNGAGAGAGAGAVDGDAAAEGVQEDQEVLVWLLRINLDDGAGGEGPASVLLPADGDDAVSRVSEECTRLLQCILPTEKSQHRRRCVAEARQRGCACVLP